MTHAYRTIDVPVRGGDLRVGVWEPEGERTLDVLAVHGVTSSHLAWPFVVEALPGVRVIAPDLRGRGASAQVEGRAGMDAHADDLAAVLDALDVPQALVVGHSMGAFVSLVFADRHAERVSRLVLVDGGLPLDVPDGMSPDEVIQHVLGPTAERLAMRFGTVGDYLDFWRAHPAFADDWTPELERYLAYDLVGEEPELCPATSYETVAEDSIDQNTGTSLADALARLRHPTVFLTAERGLLDQVPALYAAERIPTLLEQHPGLRHVAVPGVNHYTIVLSERGADAVARVVREGPVASSPSA
ncbi:alpha/beta fold hydrolase [Microbacterium sp.]|uniref:alpha/beta fold hydrolase n=1 Tax=Microbacterium sp. TaxID=51671 RepID=UPI002C8AAC1E|nr:alpha/beta fold hydrolase [Microbacterium sp.]HWL78337.1 alpha/beta fold hydrolase [Microbacterium sp.]